ncbi:ImmA/IrrE family metallo-endopeptidase [Virgibacillus dokdonensis]|uniref:ImmA/IrrE family metallo-endopeptidase n=1 Tax=Virgibacillus dokdonensis TaxID=302167 RepID=UPI00098B00B1|nr:ImmA/IrrE family metallo-endopeptidase [Virgibacillus dokdonensis]
MSYRTTPLEEGIKNLYMKLGFTEPQYPIEELAEKLNIHLSYQKKPILQQRGTIYLNPHLSSEKQKELFYYELSHVLPHVGIQLFMPKLFNSLQKHKTSYIALHLAIPTFMLQKVNFPLYHEEAIANVANEFKVTTEFSQKRLHEYRNQVNQNWNIL